LSLIHERGKTTLLGLLSCLSYAYYDDGELLLSGGGGKKTGGGERGVRRDSPTKEDASEGGVDVPALVREEGDGTEGGRDGGVIFFFVSEEQRGGRAPLVVFGGEKEKEGSCHVAAVEEKKRS